MGGFESALRKKNKVNDWYFWWKMCLVLTICHIIRLSKCEHCTLTNSNQITLVWFLYFFFCIWGRRFTKILTIPYRDRWVVCKRPKTPLRIIKMVPNWTDHNTFSRIPNTKLRVHTNYFNRLRLLWRKQQQKINKQSLFWLLIGLKCVKSEIRDWESVKSSS